MKKVAAFRASRLSFLIFIVDVDTDICLCIALNIEINAHLKKCNTIQKNSNFR